MFKSRGLILTLCLFIGMALGAEELTVSQVIFAHRAGARTENLIKLIEGAPAVAPTSPAELERLRMGGLPDGIVEAFMARLSRGTPDRPASRPDDPRLVDLVRLAKSGLSESLVSDQVRRSGLSYKLSANDLAYLKENRVSEAIIASLLGKENVPASTPPPAQVQIAADTLPPPPEVDPEVDPHVARGAAAADGLAESDTPEAIAHPEPGVAAAVAQIPGTPLMFEPLIRVRWSMKKDQMGSLGLKENRVEWYNANEPKNNFSFFGKVLKTVWLECQPRPQGNFCFELGMETLTGETYHFRDVNWKAGGNAHILQLYEALKGAYPQIVYQEKVKS